jgi:ankyrin repeat protein
MSAVNRKYFCLLVLSVLISCTPRLFGQWDLIRNQNISSIDTSEYLPNFYEKAADYNLIIASAKGYPSEIIRLIKKGADIEAETAEGATALVLAVSNNKPDAVTTLLAYKPVVDKLTRNYETPLLIAVKNGYFEVAEKLIRAGANINFQDENGAAPLHFASLYGYLDMVDLLIYYDANTYIKSNDGTTPLLTSIWSGSTEVADLLIQSGAGIEERDNEGMTPFLLASFFGDTLLMNILYKKGADIYAINADKYNALGLAIMGNHPDAVEYLMKIGSNWKDQNKSAIDPYTIASRYQNKHMISILQKNNVQGRIKYSIEQVSLTLSSRFFIHDFYSGFSLACKEPSLNIGFIAGCDTKLWPTRVLMKKSENIFYQYRDKGSVAYAGIFKDFKLTDSPTRPDWVLSTSLMAGYSFGNNLKGTSILPENKLKIIPAVSFKYTGLNLTFNCGVEYITTEFYHTGPVWLRMGLSYNYFLDNVRVKIKPPKWFNR